MLLQELAIQGVRGFSPSVRIALKPGFVVLKSPSEAAAPMSQLLLGLCYSRGKEEELALLAPGQPKAKAGVSFQSDDNTIWRLVRELGGAGSLHKLNPVSRQYESASQDAREIQSLLRDQVGLPVREFYAPIFSLTPDQFPSHKAKLKLEKIKKRANQEAEVEQTKLTALRAELESVRELSELQYRLDGLNSDLYKLEAKGREIEENKAELDAARAELENAPTPEKLGAPADIVDRVKRLPEEKKRNAEAVRRVMEEKEQAGYGNGRGVPPVWKDRQFLAAMSVGLAMLVGGALTEGALHYMALFAIGPFSFAALLGLRYVEELQSVSRNASRGDMYDLRIQKIRDEYKHFEAQVNNAMEAVGVATRDEFYAAMEQPEALKTRVAELEVRFAEAVGANDAADLPNRIAAVREEAEALNQKLTEGGGAGYGRAETDIQRDIERAEAIIGRAQTADEFGSSGHPTGANEDPTPALMKTAKELFGVDTVALWNQLKDRAVQYLMALADRRYPSAEIDAEGRAFVQAASGKTPVADLSAKDLDLWYLSLRLTLIEKHSSRVRVPVIIEDGLSGIIDESKLPLLNRMLKHLGTLTQIVLVVGSKRESVAEEGSTFAI